MTTITERETAKYSWQEQSVSCVRLTVISREISGIILALWNLMGAVAALAQCRRQATAFLDKCQCDVMEWTGTLMG